MSKTYYKDSSLIIDNKSITFNDGVEYKIIPLKSVSCIEIVREKVNYWLGIILLLLGIAAPIVLHEETFVYCLPGLIVLIYNIIMSFKRSIYIYSHSQNYISIGLGYKNVTDGSYPVIQALSKAINSEDLEIVKDELINKE